MSKSNAFENSLLLLVFNNTNIANVGDATGLRGSTTVGSLYISLHTADPGEAGTQATNECAYAGYARQPIARTTGGFTVSGDNVALAATVNFPASSAGANEVATHFAIGVAVSGATVVLYKGVLGGTQKAFTADTGDLITMPAHGLVAGDNVVFEAVEGFSLPTGITEGTSYFVIATGLTTDAFKFSTTLGGAAVDVTASGFGFAQKRQGINIIGAGVTPQLGTGTTITEG
jgi:hypothetical protein